MKRKIKNKNQKVIVLIVLAILLIGGGLYLADKKSNLSTKTPAEKKLQENKGLTKEEILKKENKEELKSADKKAEDPAKVLTEEEKQVKVVVQDFEAAYRSKDKNKIFTYFTEPTTTQDKDTKGRLISGVDSAGVSGGPALFETRSAAEVPESSEILEVTKVNSTYIVKVRENRTSVLRERKLTLVSVSGSWLIEKYESLEYPGKYTGFLNF